MVLVIQHAERVRHMILSFVACWHCRIFPQHFVSGTIVGGGELLNMVCFDFPHNVCLKHLSFKKEFSEILS